MSLKNFNLPPNCTERDIDPPPTCDCCGRDLDENSSEQMDNAMCSRCLARADEAS